MPTQTRFWLLATITVISATVSAGYALAALRAPHDSNALYAASRSLALLLVALAAVSLRSRPALIALASAMVLVQIFDTYPGVLKHDLLKTLGPLATALFNFTALVYFMRSPEANA